jgi:hypothetical protein
MLRKLAGFFRREEGGIATYVAQAVMILAVMSIAFVIIAATSNLGKFISDRIFEFLASMK